MFVSMVYWDAVLGLLLLVNGASPQSQSSPLRSVTMSWQPSTINTETSASSDVSSTSVRGSIKQTRGDYSAQVSSRESLIKKTVTFSDLKTHSNHMEHLSTSYPVLFTLSVVSDTRTESIPTLDGSTTLGTSSPSYTYTAPETHTEFQSLTATTIWMMSDSHIPNHMSSNPIPTSTVTQSDSHIPNQMSSNPIPTSMTQSDSHIPNQTFSNPIPTTTTTTTVTQSDSHIPNQTSIPTSTVTQSDSHIPNQTSIPTSTVTQSDSNTTSMVTRTTDSPPSKVDIPLNYQLILYIVPPLGVVVLLLMIVSFILCIRRYRRVRRYRRQLIPLTDRDGSDDSDDEEEELDNREPAFMVTPMSRPMLAFADT